MIHAVQYYRSPNAIQRISSLWRLAENSLPFPSSVETIIYCLNYDHFFIILPREFSYQNVKTYGQISSLTTAGKWHVDKGKVTLACMVWFVALWECPPSTTHFANNLEHFISWSKIDNTVSCCSTLKVSDVARFAHERVHPLPSYPSMIPSHRYVSGGSKIEFITLKFGKCYCGFFCLRYCIGPWPFHFHWIIMIGAHGSSNGVSRPISCLFIPKHFLSYVSDWRFWYKRAGCRPTDSSVRPARLNDIHSIVTERLSTYGTLQEPSQWTNAQYLEIFLSDFCFSGGLVVDRLLHELSRRC